MNKELKKQLTERENDVLNVIKNNIVLKPPTQETIGKHLGITKQTINEHIKNLKKKGYLMDNNLPIEYEEIAVDLLYGNEILFNSTNFKDFNFNILN